jgi:hypothetical protein
MNSQSISRRTRRPVVTQKSAKTGSGAVTKVKTYLPDPQNARCLTCCKSAVRWSEKPPISTSGENTFGLWTPESLIVWKHFTRPRHINRIRKVQLLHWTRLQGVGGDEAFEGLSTLLRLEFLTFVVNEAQQLENLLAPWRYEYQYESVHRAIRWDTSLGFGPQIGLQTLRVTGIVGLRSLEDYVK